MTGERNPPALLQRARRSLAACTFFIAALYPAVGQATAAPAGLPAASQIERWLRQTVELPAGQRLRLEIEVGQFSRGLKLAPCERAEPFVPGHARLWGRTTIGVRCVVGARWTTYLPVRVSAWGPALVARARLPAGKRASADDFLIREVDWAATRSVPIASADLLRGQELWRPIAADQPLTTDDLRLAPAVRAGDPVGVVLAGNGFSIGIEAVALSTATHGQRVQVRTGNGKVLSGMVEGNIVKIAR